MECEQQLLEKELVQEQVGKLTERAQKKVESQRASTLAVAKKVNNYQARIKDVTRKMMALVSELSMQQVHVQYSPAYAIVALGFHHHHHENIC